MNCLKPVTLKSGIVVPCGKCELCRSDKRNEWSVRLAIHLENCQFMPMFLTLTYDNDHLPYNCLDYGTKNFEIFSSKDFEDVPEMSRYWYPLTPTLHRKDISAFLKAYKRKYGLLNDEFQYFGCGEYGGLIGRPHYHLLFFGDNELYKMWFDDVQSAVDRVSKVWDKGYIHIGVAGFDGIHYVTKYCLKEDYDELNEYQVKPFTIASNGLGMNFLDSEIGKRTKSQLEYIMRNRERVLSECPDFDIYDIESLQNALDYFERVVPAFKVILQDGRKVYLPRAIRKKLVGSVEHFKDSPLWMLTHLKMLCDSYLYYKEYGQYDKEHDTNHSFQQCLTRLEKIRKRLLESKYNKNSKKL